VNRGHRGNAGPTRAISASASVPSLVCTINGRRLRLQAHPLKRLLDVLREDWGLTGTKEGCGEGECGACTVLVGGQLTRSCVTPVGAVAGQSVLTIEGLEQQGRLHPLQQAFLDHDALQCGYCTPGMIMSSLALLLQCPNPSEEQIIHFMQGNICRCGTYPRIIRAIQQAAADLRAARGEQ
jgi:aerobic-type carbon monoxide dehydrogenase small subunit (CoxS/CutS family)